MDYKALYEEARERAKQVKLTDMKENVAAAEYIFPELKESEDERIRKQLLDFLEHLHLQGKTMDFDVWSKSDCANWIRWLEKQKEQKVSHLHPEDYPMAPGECIKSVWSEEDEKKIHFLSRLIDFQVNDGEYCFGGNHRMVSKQEAIEMLLSLRPQPHWKPSKEQMKALDKAIPVCMGVAGKDECSPLISLYEQLKKLM